MSINESFKGRRIKTDKCKRYERVCLMKMPTPKNLKTPIPEEGNLQIHFRFGFSSKGSDWDNPVKVLQDLISKRKYKFNDNRIYKAIVEKVDVKKGNEFIEFDIYGHRDLSDKDLDLINLINKHGYEKALQIFNK